MRVTFLFCFKYLATFCHRKIINWKLLTKINPHCLRYPIQTFFMPQNLFLFWKKERKSNFCTNLYHDLKKRNEKTNWKTLKRNWKGNKTFLSDLKEKIEKQNETNRHWKKNYTQRKIFHNILYEHKICMQNAAFLMCLIEACNTKKNQCHTPFSLQGSSMYDVTTFSSNCSTPPFPIKQLFSLIP